MGTYLTTGIVQNIIINKKEALQKNLAINNIAEKLKEGINIDFFNFSEDTESYYWNIMPSILEGNLADFLDTQFQMYGHEKTEAMLAALSKVSTAKTGQELIELAVSRELKQFRLVKYITTYLRVLRNDCSAASISVNYHLIAFFMDGKIIMECYDSILGYLEKNIRLQKTKYPIAECIKIMISG